MKVRFIGKPAEPMVAFDLETMGLPASRNPCGEIALGRTQDCLLGATMDAHAKIPWTLANVWSTCPRSSVDRATGS